MKPIERDVHGATAAHATLSAALADLSDEQVSRPSLLPGWTVGHVLTHIARNADSHVLMLLAANNGEVGLQYPGGLEQRTADIEAGAKRSAAELIADIKSSNASLEAAWAATTEVGWAGSGQSPSGLAAVADMPIRRWKEVVVHQSDLGPVSGRSYGWADWPSDFVRRDLQRMTAVWASRKPMGLTTLPAEALAVDDGTRLAWLLGRTSIEGLAAADIYW